MFKIYAHLGPIHHPKGNLGDKFGFIIGDFLLGENNYKKLGMHDVKEVDEKTIALVGSSLAALTESSATVLGAGIINSSPRKYSEELKFLGVRGFLTQSMLLRDAGLQVNVVGDPGLLISKLFCMPFVQPSEKRPLGFIIHKVDRPAFIDKYPEYAHLMVDNHEEPEVFVEQLSKYEMIASTSLHGCVFCHSYGIPVAPFVLTDKLFGGDFKFTDYYSSLGIDMPKRYTLDGENRKIIELINNTRQPSLRAIKNMQEQQLFKIESYFKGWG